MGCARRCANAFAAADCSSSCVGESGLGGPPVGVRRQPGAAPSGGSLQVWIAPVNSAWLVSAEGSGPGETIQVRLSIAFRGQAGRQRALNKRAHTVGRQPAHEALNLARRHILAGKPSNQPKMDEVLLAIGLGPPRWLGRGQQSIG